MKIQQVENLDEEIRILYGTDEEFINNYHLKTPTLENCIEDAKGMCKKCDELFKIIGVDGELKAIFGKTILNGEEHICPFFIHPFFRNEKNEIFELMLSKFSKPLISLSVKNKKAMNFFINNNFTLVGIIEDDGITNCNFVVLKKR